jgi:putative tricarboxylic transport membrane protein
VIKNAGLWIGLSLVGFSGTILYKSFEYAYYGSYGPGPGLLPRWLGGSLLILSILFIIDSVRNGAIDIGKLLPQGSGRKKVVAVFIALLLFLFIVPYAGYTLASVLMLFILFRGGYKWYSSLAFSLCVSFVIFYIFKFLLSVPLPVNSLGI